MLGRYTIAVLAMLVGLSANATILNVSGTFNDGGTLSGTINVPDDPSTCPINNIANLTTTSGTDLPGATYIGVSGGVLCSGPTVTNLVHLFFGTPATSQIIFDFSPPVGLSATSSYVLTIEEREPGASRGALGTAMVAAAVPEPATLALLGIGLAGLGFSRRRTLN